jgi:predicted glycoside hydrolase/deacetylase ChbG (UPF0249 family)
MQRFVLCADDFALTDKISRAILTLLDERRLSATGAMTNRPGWARWAAELARFADVADLGLHLNLTCGSPLGRMPILAPDGRLPSLRRLVGRALASADARAEIADETARQIDAFTQAMGRLPDFVDGHQHVHAMPGVRAAVLPVLVGEEGLAATVYLRDPADRLSAIRARGVCVGKASLIALLAAGFASEARDWGFALNEGFSGVSSFDPSRDFTADLDRYVARPGRRHLVMCHPGLADDVELDGLDPVIASRPAEFAALRRWRPPGAARFVRFANVHTNNMHEFTHSE